MKNTLLHIKSFLALLTLTTLLGLVTASAQLSSQGGTQSIPQDNDTTRGEIASFDRFMDSHPEMAEQLRRDPSLVTNEEFVKNHPALQEYLQQHPGVREEITENPNRFMRQEQRFDRREDRRDNDRRDNDTTRGELASFDRFMDSHPEIAEQLRRDPSLVTNHEFVKNHPALQEYLQQHPGTREEITENPDRFMHQEQRYDRREDRRDSDQPESRRDEDRRDFNRPEGQRDEDRRDNDTTRGELASFDRFMDGHPEIAEQLRRDPSLAKNQEFVERHPALQEYLQQHPGVQQEISENPDRFMRQEQHFDRAEDRRDFDRTGDRRDNDTTRGELANFDRFMDGHPEIAEQLRRDPSLAKNREFVERHPALQEYLQQHPGVQQEISENPDRFMRQEQHFDRAEDRRDFDRTGDRRDNDTTRGELANFDRFMDGHPEIAEQLRRDPSLAKNREFVRSHPALQEYLQQHPEVHEELTENPNRFMRQEQRFDRIEDNRNHDTASGDMDNFREFHGSHSTLAQQLSQDPRLANSEEFQTNHPELQQFLKAHPVVQEGLKQNPQMFMKSAQQFSGSQAPKTPNVEPKPKQ